MRLWKKLEFLAASRRPECARQARSRPQLEGLEQRTLLTVTVPTPGNPGTAKITGTSGPDQMLIRLQPGSPLNIQLSDNGGASFTTAALRDVNNIGVSGLGGPDTLILDHANGFVGRIGLLPITFDGGPGKDTLIQQGNPNLVGMNVTYTIGTSSDEGRIDATNGTISNSINFSQLNAIIDVTNANVFTLALNESNNVVKVERDKGHAGATTLKFEGVDQQGRNDPIDLVLEDRPGGDRKVPSGHSFVPITLANKANVTLNTFAGNDLITLDHSRPVSGLVSLTIDGGTGTDRVYSDNAPSGANLNLVSIEKNVPEGLDDAFIAELYVTRIKRSPEEAEVENWKSVIRAGHGRQGVVSAIERSVESRTRQVRGWYDQYLARSASGGEEQGWINALTGGMTEELIVAGILGSPEFFNRARTLFSTGSGDERFLRALYQILMGRQPDNSELSGWLNILTPANRGGVALTFMSSAEFRGRIIDAYYNAFLQRDAEASGRLGWVASPLNLTQIREGFASSIEFYDLNHASATRVQFDFNNLANFSGLSVNSSDKQFYLVIPPRDGTLNINVGSTNGRFARAQIEDALGNKLFETEPRDGVNSGSVVVKGGQQYYLRLRALDTNPAGFTVTLRLA